MQKEQQISWLIFAYILGILYFFSTPFNFYNIAFIPLILLIIILIKFKKYMFSLIVLFFSLGILISEIRTNIINTKYIENTIKSNIVGIVDKVEKRQNGTRITLKNVSILNNSYKEQPLLKKIRITSLVKNLEYEEGDLIKTYALLSPPLPPIVPFGYDFQRNQYFLGISAQGFMYGKGEILEKNYKPKKVYIWQQSKIFFENKFEKYFNKNTAPIAKAIFLGNTTEIDNELREDYQIAGVAHILAISGLHVALISALFFLIIRSCLSLIPIITLRFNTKKLAAFLSIIFILFYVLMVGAPVSAIRAFIMISIALIAVIIDRNALSIRSVVIAAFIMLIFMPEMLLAIGFQLSFVAVLTIIFVFENIKIEYKSGIYGKLRNFLIISSLTTLSVEITLLPFIAYYFGNIPVYSIFTNIIVLPIISFIIIPFGIMGMIFSNLDILAKLMFFITDLGINLMNNITKFIANTKFSVLSIHIIPPFLVFLIFVSASFIILIPRFKKQFFILFLSLILVVIFFPRPIVLMAPTQKIIAFYIDNEWVFSYNTKSEFIKSQWVRFDKKSNQLITEKLDCIEKACAIYTKSGRISVPNDIYDAYEECKLSVLVLFPTSNLNCENIIDINFLNKNGAIAIYNTPIKPIILTRKMFSGSKIWNTYN